MPTTKPTETQLNEAQLLLEEEISRLHGDFGTYDFATFTWVAKRRAEILQKVMEHHHG